MANAKEIMVVELTGFWLNDRKPEDWDKIKKFAWKPSLSFYYKAVDDDFRQVGEEVKARIYEDLWLWQVLGGKQAKGHFFQVAIESGDHPSPWTSVMPTAEVYKDGQMTMIKKPANVQNVTQSAPTSTPAAPARTAAPATQKNTAKDPDYKGKAAAFMARAGESNSDAWWTLKRAFDFDCTDAVNCLEMAQHIALIEVSKTQYEGGDAGFLGSIRSDLEQGIDYWMRILRGKLRAQKFANLKERFEHMVHLCMDKKSIEFIVEKAYMDLPRTDYEDIRGAAIARMGQIGSQTATVDGTMQPEVWLGEQPKEEAKLEEEIPF